MVKKENKLSSDSVNKSAKASLIVKTRLLKKQAWLDYALLATKAHKSFSLFDYFEVFDMELEQRILEYDFSSLDFETSRSKYHEFYLKEWEQLIDLDIKPINYTYAFKAIIFIHLADHALTNKQYLIAQLLSDKYVKCDAIFKHVRGLSFSDIVNQAPKPIKIGEERLKSKIKLLASKIWEEDIERRLMPSHVANMITQLWVKKANGDNIRSINRLVEWFNEDEKTIPNDIKIMTKNKTYPKGRSNKIRREEEEVRIKLAVKPYADQLIQELNEGLY